MTRKLVFLLAALLAMTALGAPSAVQAQADNSSRAAAAKPVRTLYVRALCAWASISDPGGRGPLCRDMELCEKTGDPLRCDAYCGAELQGLDVFPGSGLQLGPVSAVCLSVNKRVRGSNWVEVRGRTQADGRPDSADTIPFKCQDSKGSVASSEPKFVLCKPGTTMCASGFVNEPIQFFPIEALASKLCERR